MYLPMRILMIFRRTNPFTDQRRQLVERRITAIHCQYCDDYFDEEL
jgi:hypothetical protein